MYHIVYLTTNLINNRIYIGKQSTINLEDGYLGSGIALTNALNKYGKENFSRQILFYCLSSEDAYEIERQIVDESFIKRADVYNIALGGNGGNTRIGMSEERKQYLDKLSSESRIGKSVIHSDSHKQWLSENCKNFNIQTKTGISISQEHKDKISKTTKGIPKTEETKKRMSEANKGEKNSMFGKKVSNDIKKLISEASKLRWADPVYREKMKLSRIKR